MAHLSVRLLGPFDVCLNDKPVSGFVSDKVRALLAYLVTEPDRAHRRETLAGLLWSDVPEASARNSLRTALVNLRTVIGDRAADLPFLHISRTTLQFNGKSDAWCDLTAFRRLVASSSNPRHEEEVVQSLEEAIELYRGSFLEGFSLADSVAFEDWALIRREQFLREMLKALYRVTAFHEQRADLEQGLRFAWRQVALDPWREEAQRQLMRLLASSGQRGSALTQYETLRRQLADELGIEPGAETRALCEQIRDGALTAPQRALPTVSQPAPLPALSLDASLLGERRAVTVLWADIRGLPAFSTRVESEGRDVTWDEMLDGFAPEVQRPLRAEAVRFGGQVDQHGWGGLVVCFGAGTVHEDDPERAVLAALAMQKAFADWRGKGAKGPEHGAWAEELGLLVVIHSEEVVVAANDEAGPGGAAIREARGIVEGLPSEALNGEVWVSETTRRLVEPLFEWSLWKEARTEASGRPRRVCRVLGRRARPDKMRGIAGLSSPLIGRDAESRALQAAIVCLRDGVGGIVTVVGEAGIGKSRLVAEARKLFSSITSGQALRTAQGSVLDAAEVSAGDLPSASQSPNLKSPNPRWIEGRCLSYATHVAYQVWADVLQSLLGLDAGASPEAAAETLRKGVGALCGAQAGEVHPFLARMISLPLDDSAKERLSGIEGEGLHVLTFRAVEMLLERAAEQTPLAVVCEDLHWADATSVGLLLRLLSLTERAPILWICVFRPETEHACWQIKEIAARHYAHRYTDLWLGPLSAGESAQVVGYLLRIQDLPVALRSRVLDRAEGNPFYVEETLRVLIDEGALAFDPRSERWQVVRELSEFALPGTLRAVLAARIDRLSQGTRQVLHLASVLGRRFGRRELEVICAPFSGLGDERAPSRRGEGLGVGKALEAHLAVLQRTQMIREQSRVPETTYTFKHQLTLEAAYDGLPRQNRRVLHRRVAEALERLFPERIEEQLGLLAHHWEQAGENEQAVDYLHRAGEQAAAQYANDEAIGYIVRALELTPQDDLETRFALLVTREAVYDVQGAREAQHADLEALEALAEATGDGGRRAEVAWRKARYAVEIADHRTAIAAARQAVHLAQVAHDVESQVQSHLLWAQALVRQRDAKAVQIQCQEALALSRAAALYEAQATSLCILGLDSLRRDPAKARHYFERALDLYRQISDRHSEGLALGNLGGAYLRLGEYIQARTCCEQALALLRQTGDRMAEGQVLGSLAEVSRLSGSYAAAIAYQEQALQISRAVGSRLNEAWVCAHLGIVHFELGDYTTARAYREQALGLFRDLNNRVFEGWSLYQLGQTYHFQGDYDSAGAFYERALRIGRETNDWEVEAKALTYKGLLFHHLGDDYAARAYCQQVLRIIPDQDLGRALDLVYVYVVLGHALAGQGSLTEAADAYRQALTTRRAFLVVEPQAGLARVALGQGDSAGALAYVREILDYMAERPLLEGTKEPLRVYLTCISVLRANGDLRANKVLDAAYHMLQERARQIEDPVLRRSYLENVPAHREIVALWKETSPQ